MRYAEEYEGSYGVDVFAADAALDARAAFIRRTYLHVFGAIVAFIGLEAIVFNVEAIKMPIVTAIGNNWWMALVGFMIVTWLADRWAHSGASESVQYLGLGLYVLAEAIIFVPLLFMAQLHGPDIIPAAAGLTMFIFGGLTMIVMITKQDFSFLRGILWLCSIAALGLILASWLFGFTLGIVFVVAMIVLMCGFILYYTSNVLHHYRTDQHVAAALALFGAIATLFWYVLRLMMYLSEE
ncbi:MAG: Bax inhibitor-1 family protein [Planctomycetes bacterium]|nr:Bax inhibitor-1 family protein [Planctomycetota bacterium]